MQRHEFLNAARERKSATDPNRMSVYRVGMLTGITTPYASRIFREPANMSEGILRKICGILDIKYTGVRLETKDGERWEADEANKKLDE